MSIPSLHRKIFRRLFKGSNIQDINNHVGYFLAEQLEKMLYLPTIECLKAAQLKGDYIVILSSSPQFLVEPIADHLGVNHWKASFYKTDFSGKLSEISEIIEGQGKANYVELLSKELNITRSNITVYSDSYLDLPVLKMAGKAVGVVPDPYLRKECLKNGWEIL